MFKKILIANRGEIAVRIIRACREMGIRSTAVYSEADRRSLAVRLADEGVAIGSSDVEKSYLSIERILQAASDSDAEAIHPGYGLLSENADFAQAVQDAGLTFIGPSPEAIRIMGNKGLAREKMNQSGIPIVPGYQGPEDTIELVKNAHKIGYPIMVKAAAGGGGKGMRIVNNEDNLIEEIASARREALHAFGDQRLILERFIPHARHIEFQILADHSGKTLHLFERECSVQRRHQKIIEESPSPLLGADLRRQMGEAAVAAARTVGYQNAGTIEFIVDPTTQHFYFLEMNTRLQVEHAVTELVTGLDIVQWQIRIAAGESLPYLQDDLNQHGHALECRLYAEDPANQFLPTTGKLLHFVEPKGPGVRVDSGYTSGDEITIHYDPLISKTITWGEDRQASIRKMLGALRETVILGVTHNGQFLQDVLASRDFQSGEVDTTWIEDVFGDWKSPDCELPPEVLAAAALTQFQSNINGVSEKLPREEWNDPYNPWRIANGFRIGE